MANLFASIFGSHADATPGYGRPVRRLRNLDASFIVDPTNEIGIVLTLSEAEAGISPFHFAREFQRVTGVSPHQHLIRCRVDRAILLLASRQATVTDVAHAVGFTHSSHLARHMRRLTSLTPNEFRTKVLP